LEGLRDTVPGTPIVVVDDGSSDSTADVAAAYSSSGVHVVRHTENRGKGAALMTGLTYARDTLGLEWVITLDADGQHLPDDLEGFLSASPLQTTGILAGVRQRQGTPMPWHRRFSNASTTWLISRLAGVPVFDAQCGYRAYRLELTAILPPVGRFEWESQAMIVAARRGWAIEPVPVKTIYSGEGSHMNLVRDTLRFLRMAFGPRGMAWTR
jgi:glycosyltransferase involved in cell wall biosynthesis